MKPLRALLWAREQTESGGDDRDDDGNASIPPTSPSKRKLLRMRCYACAGTGRLELVENRAKPGRVVRCIACGGTGKIAVEAVE